MSERMSSRYFDYKHLGGWVIGLGALAGISCCALLVGAFIDPAQFAFSYLVAFAFFFTLSVGALFWVLIHHIVDAEWSVGVRRQLENVASLFSALGILFIPLVFVAPLLWTWMQPGAEADPAFQEKAMYLNAPFFWGRAAVYFFVFAALAWLLRGFSIAQDEDGAAGHTLACRRVAFAGAMPFALCLTFASIDWLMGLDWHWYSAIWGVYIFAGSVLGGLCLMVVIVTALRSAGYFRDIVTLEHYQIMGKLLLAFTVFWAYIAFSQYLIIWYANIPEEMVWFERWNQGGWRNLTMLLVAGHFFVPFLLLLSVVGKRQPRFLCGVAIWILCMHLLDIFLVVMPVLHPAGAWPGVMDVLAFLATGSVLALVFFKRMGDAALYPVNDPRLAASQSLTNE